MFWVVRCMFTLSFSFSLTSTIPNLLYAAQIEEIQKDGSLKLDDGSSLKLAGIILSTEAPKIIAAISAGQELEIEIVPTDSASQSAYVYILSHEISLPFDPLSIPNTQRRMMNEMLLQMGAASLEKGTEFLYKSRFQALEDEAKMRGYGIWSYELLKKSNQVKTEALLQT